jgi:hypothetical protein
MEHESTTADEPPTDTSAAATAESVPLPDALTGSDLEVLRDDPRVPFEDARMDHDSRDHCSTDIAGRAVLGITNDAGEVHVLDHHDSEMYVLPNAPVPSDDADWAAAARDIVEVWDGLTVESVELVREVAHYAPDEDDPHTTSKTVLFGGSATGDAATDLSIPGDDWSADWHASPPVDLDELGSPLADDLAYFFD